MMHHTAQSLRLQPKCWVFRLSFVSLVVKLFEWEKVFQWKRCRIAHYRLLCRAQNERGIVVILPKRWQMVINNQGQSITISYSSTTQSCLRFLTKKTQLHSRQSNKLNRTCIFKILLFTRTWCWKNVQNPQLRFIHALSSFDVCYVQY